MKSLNEAYMKGKADPLVFHYWCKDFGEINPLEDPYRCGSLDDLPSDVRIIYMNLYENDKCGVYNYVVSAEHVPGIALIWLFIEDPEKPIDIEVIRRVASAMENDFPFATAYVGENTDLYGHEIALFIPADHIREFYRMLPEPNTKIRDKYYGIMYDLM